MLQIASAEQVMTSREIAELVESRHDAVKKSIERLIERGVISSPPLANFKNINNVEGFEYRICKRDSYVIVAQLSPEFTAKLVDRWQELEEKNISTLPAIVNPQIEAMVMALQMLDSVQQKQSQQETKLLAHESMLADVEARHSGILDGFGFYAISGYASLKHIKIDSKLAAHYGKLATAESKKQGVMMGSVPDAKYGSVHSYHVDILDAIFADLQ